MSQVENQASASTPTVPAATSRPFWTTERIISSIIVLALVAVPVIAFYSGARFWVDIATRLVILSIAAVGLNFILGYGGMISFGHAAFIGLGAYAVGIPTYHSIYDGFPLIATSNGFFHVALAVAVCAVFALVTGAISLRTKGVHFIMITMAFGQMMYFAIVSIEKYGGDDGLTIDTRSELPLISLDQPLMLYGLALVSLLVIMYLVHRMVNSRFGMVLQGAKQNEERLRALGVNVYAYKLTAYVMSGVICGYAGALLGNFSTFISPEMMDWTRSGELMFMVILGGTAFLFGPLIGAAVFLLLEESLSGFTIFWHLPFGILLILSVLFIRGGLSGLLQRMGGSRDR
ncbi:MAG: branched-chain amino acid ABC transporter permease [Hyphomicrobiales bacterium]|nr:branched-chain amino acid ABC transporter permease [Hyphomicrobiales bacterium]